MAGNRAIFDRAMEQSREAARLKQWDNALKNAARALQEFPNHNEARSTVAVSLFHTGKLEQALQLLQEMHAADPDNPFFLEYIARAQERKGDIDAALNTYSMLLDLHEQDQAVSKTIQVLREMLRLEPALDEQRELLAALLSERRATQEAATEYMKLAHSYQQQGLLDEAAERVETALRLMPDSREAKELVMAIRNQMASAAGLEVEEPSEEDGESASSAGRSMTSSLRSQDFTLEKLVATAIEKQEAGDLEGAMAFYERAIEQGLERADIFYSLGLLYQEMGNHQDAVQMLERSTADPEYALSAHFSLGTSYAEMNQLQQAAQEFEQAIGQVDLSTVGKTESEDLIQMYEQVTDIYQKLGDMARAASLYSTLANFLKGKRWGKERAEEFTRRAKELTDMNMMAKLRSLGTGALATPPPDSATEAARPQSAEPEENVPQQWGKIPSIIDFLRTDNLDYGSEQLTAPAEALPQADPLEVLETLPQAETDTVAPVTPLDTTGLDEQVVRWVKLSERYTEQRLFEAALDACYEVMLLAPTYLPIHIRMGEVFERQHLTEEAMAKYQTLIDTFTVREEPERAIDVYFRYISLAPDTIKSRTRLAELLHQVGRVDEAALQLVYVADSYLRMGQTNRAMEEYRRGLQWAPKNKELRSQYGLALFRIGRYEAAMSEFHKAADPQSPIAIAHINMTLAMLAEQPAAIWDSLAALLEQIDAGGDSNAVQAEYRTALMSADDPLLHYILGIIQQHCEQHSSALLEFETAQALLEGEEHLLLPIVLVHQAMASSYIALEQPDQALEHLQLGQKSARHVKADPAIKHSFARPLAEGELVWQMAEAYAAADDLPSAEKALREALRHLPYNQHIYTKLADVCFRQGKLEEALTSLDNLATYHENRQDLDQAIQILEYGIKLAPGSISLRGRLARLYIRRGYPDKGVEGLVRVAELQRKDGHIKDAVSSLQQAAEIRWMQNKQDETLALYDKIVQVAPGDVEARQWRAIMYTLVSRTSEAIAEKKQIVQLLIQRKDYDNAIAELHQIIGLNTDDVEAYYMLGDMLMRRGEYAQALNLYTRLSKMDEVESERVEALIAAANQMLQNQQVTS